MLHGIYEVYTERNKKFYLHKMEIDILGITEKKKKGKGMDAMRRGFLLKYSGINPEGRKRGYI